MEQSPGINYNIKTGNVHQHSTKAKASGRIQAGGALRTTSWNLDL